MADKVTPKMVLELIPRAPHWVSTGNLLSYFPTVTYNGFRAILWSLHRHPDRHIDFKRDGVTLMWQRRESA